MIARLGAALPATLAAAPPARPPITWPAAQAMLERPAAKPWCRRLDSATSESMVRAGVKQMPPPSEVRIKPGHHHAHRLPDRHRGHRHRADAEADHEGHAPPGPVGVAAGERRQDRLQGGAGDEAAGDQRVTAAEVGDLQRHQHLDRAEHHRGDRDEGGREQDRPA